MLNVDEGLRGQALVGLMAGRSDRDVERALAGKTTRAEAKLAVQQVRASIERIRAMPPPSEPFEPETVAALQDLLQIIRGDR
jgi:hypothetical protein